MPRSAQAMRAERSAAQAALIVIIGIVASGPLALLVVAATHPQPAWSGAAAFAAAYRPIQLLPYVGGLVLVGGCVALVASLAALLPASRRARAAFALALAAAFAALIALNYIVQTTFVPSLVRPYDPAQDAIIAALTMTNPRSLAWALEMWGYAVLGIATWTVAVAFGRSRLERATARICVANGIISVAGGIATAASPGWVQTTPGLIAFAAWNLVMVVLGALVIATMRRRRSPA